MVKVSSLTKVISMMVNGKMVTYMELASINGKMVKLTLVNGIKANVTGLEYSPVKTVSHTMANGSMV